MASPTAPREKQGPVGLLQRIMSRPPVTVGPDVSLADAAELMLREGVGSLLVVDASGQLIGIVTDGDFTARKVGIPFSTFRAPQLLGEWLGAEGVERICREARRRTVADVMSSRVHAVEADGGLDDTLQLMLAHDIKHVPITQGGRPVGMITGHDLLKLMVNDGPEKGSVGDDGA